MLAAKKEAAEDSKKEALVDSLVLVEDPTRSSNDKEVMTSDGVADTWRRVVWADAELGRLPLISGNAVVSSW